MVNNKNTLKERQNLNNMKIKKKIIKFKIKIPKYLNLRIVVTSKNNKRN
jgi:hypothetical protein